MKTYSAYNDDGMTITVMASNEKHAVEKTADKIAEIGIEMDPDFFEDAIDEAYMNDDETVSDWLMKNGVTFTEIAELPAECPGFQL